MLGISLPFGDIAEKICDSILPKELSIVGDLVGGYVDFQTGNYAGMVGHGLEAFGDLNQMQQSLGKPKEQDDAGPSWSHEPSLPMFRGGWRGLAAQKVIDGAAALKDSTVWRGSPPATENKTDQTTSSKTETAEASAAAESKKTGNVVEDFFNKSSDDFMQAVRDGKIPEEIKKSPAEMQRLQAKMNDITQMNQLITSLLQAMHQMNMAIIQNVRV